MTDEISVEASDVGEVLDTGYIEVVEAEAPVEVDIADGTWVDYVERESEPVATDEPAAEQPADVPGFIAEHYGSGAADTDADSAPAADDQTATTESAPAASEEPSLREKLIEQGIIKPAPEPVAADEEAKIEEWQKLRAKLEAEDDKLKAKKAEAEKPEKPSWQQRLKTGAQKAGSGLQKAGGGISKGLRKASTGLRKALKTTTPPATTPRPKAQTPKPQTTPKAAGPSKAQKLGGALGKVLGAPRRAANGLRSAANSMRQALPKSQPPAAEPTPRPKSSPPVAKSQEAPKPNGLGAGQRFGQALGSALGLPGRIAQGVREKLPRSGEKPEEAPPKTGPKPTSPTPPGGGRGGELPSPGAGLAGLGRALPLGLAGLAVAFLAAGGVARTTQAVGGIRATPLVVIAAALFAATILLTLFRR